MRKRKIKHLQKKGWQGGEQSGRVLVVRVECYLVTTVRGLCDSKNVLGEGGGLSSELGDTRKREKKSQKISNLSGNGKWEKVSNGGSRQKRRRRGVISLCGEAIHKGGGGTLKVLWNAKRVPSGIERQNTKGIDGGRGEWSGKYNWRKEFRNRRNKY